jgi:hypothetical protein
MTASWLLILSYTILCEACGSGRTHCNKGSRKESNRKDCNSLHRYAVTAACKSDDFRVPSNFDIQLVVTLCQEVVGLSTQEVSRRGKPGIALLEIVHTKESCVWLRRCRFCSRKKRFFLELIRNSICLISILLACWSFGDLDCNSEIMLRAVSKCKSTASDSRSISERNTLHPFSRCTIKGRSRSRGSTVFTAMFGRCLVSCSTSLISDVHLPSSPKVRSVSKSMMRTGRSKG